jgi:hypothetical protein
MCQLTIAVPGADSLQSAIRNARELALRSPEKWAQAWHDLYGDALNDVIFAAMDGDECHAGRVLIQRLRAEIIEAATDAAKDAAADAEDEVFERESLTERRAEEAERSIRAISEGTP